MYYYQIGRNYKVKGVIRKLIGFEYCINEGEGEICDNCCGKLKFDNGVIVCGWLENVKLGWIPMCPEENDKDETGLEYDKNGKVIYDEK